MTVSTSSAVIVATCKKMSRKSKKAKKCQDEVNSQQLPCLQLKFYKFTLKGRKKLKRKLSVFKSLKISASNEFV